MLEKRFKVVLNDHWEVLCQASTLWQGNNCWEVTHQSSTLCIWNDCWEVRSEASTLCMQNVYWEVRCQNTQPCAQGMTADKYDVMHPHCVQEYLLGSNTSSIHTVYKECLLEVRRHASTLCTANVYWEVRRQASTLCVEPTNYNIYLGSLPHLVTLSSLINYDICSIIIVSEKYLARWVYHLCAKLKLM